MFRKLLPTTLLYVFLHFLLLFFFGSASVCIVFFFFHPIPVFTSSKLEFAVVSFRAIEDKRKSERGSKRKVKRESEKQNQKNLLKCCNTILFWMDLTVKQQQQQQQQNLWKSVFYGFLFASTASNILWKTLQLDTHFNFASCFHPYPIKFFFIYAVFFSPAPQLSIVIADLH